MAFDQSLLSIFDQRKAGHDEGYYNMRRCLIDCRGTLSISPTTWWGWESRVITQSHGIHTGQFFGPAIDAPVYVDDYVWVTSYCILCNCHINHHAIVSIGSVVNGVEIPPNVIVAGNPVKIVARWNGEKWQSLKRPLSPHRL